MLHFPMVRAAALSTAAALLLCGQAGASERGSAEDQLACTPDVYRLCSNFVPDENAIVACLNRNVRALTPACQKVMTRPATPNESSDNDTD